MDLLASLDALEAMASGGGSAGAGVGCAGAPGEPIPAGPPETSRVDNECDTARRLNGDLASKGCAPSKFVRVPAQYYDEDLEFRRRCLNGKSVDHLCKSITMENTKAKGVEDCSNPKNSRWYIVVVQYTAKLNQQKIEKFLHELNVPLA